MTSKSARLASQGEVPLVPEAVPLAGIIRHSGPVSPWFARLDLSEASAAQRRVVQRVCDLLDQLQPARLDPAHQVVEPVDGETWVKLRHDSDPSLHIEFVLSGGRVNFYGVMGHDEAYSASPEPADAWESETIDILADLLQSPFTIETYTLGGKPWREIVTVGEPYNLALTGGHAYGLRPLQRWATRTDSRHASFECRGARASQRDG
jgi:hypothetical protein